jgi:hypothetical protein
MAPTAKPLSEARRNNVKKPTWKAIRQAFVILALIAILVGTSFELSNEVLAQATGYRYSPQGLVLNGYNGALCFESTYLSGVTSCLQQMSAGSIGATLGNINTGWANLTNAPVAALATATTGGFIPNGTSYRLGIRYITITGGSTIITAAQEATQTTTGSGTSTITVTAPLAAAGAAGYVVDSTNASGVGLSNATLTELTQPMSVTVCAGAFQVNGPNGPGTGLTVCPFAANAVLTNLIFAVPTVFTPNIPGGAAGFPAGGTPTPIQNTAAYPAGVPELICNLLPQTALATITTIQVLGSCPFQPNVQNQIGKVLHIQGQGVYTSGAQTGTMTLSLVMGGITPMTITSPAIITGGQTNAQFDFDWKCTTLSTGAAATLMCTGLQDVNLATANNLAALTREADNIHGVASSAINLTAANTATANITMSSSTTSAQLLEMRVYLEN